MIKCAPLNTSEYCVKSGYDGLLHIQNNSIMQRPFLFNWNPSISPKARSFTWLALKKKVLRSD